MAVIGLAVTQVLWVVLLGVVASYWLWRDLTLPGSLLLGFLAAYVYMIVALYRGKRWAWWLCWVPPLISLVLAAPNVVYNFVLFFSDDPLYLDSPGTILVVAVHAILFVIPPSAIAVLLVWSRTLLPSNSALLTDAYSSPLRAQYGAAKRGR